MIEVEGITTWSSAIVINSYETRRWEVGKRIGVRIDF